MYTQRRLRLHKLLDCFVTRNIVHIIINYDCISEEYEANKKQYKDNILPFIYNFKLTSNRLTVQHRIYNLLVHFYSTTTVEMKINCITLFFNEVISFLWWFKQEKNQLYMDLLHTTILKKLNELKQNNFPNAYLYYEIIYKKLYE